MYVALTWNTDAAHARLHRWQVHVLDRWAREDDDRQDVEATHG
ncbi:hypothetical protein [Mycolicibacterium mucogenicum]|nr:hypothetical protein [Mycolicibacterium mucogenicum]